MTGEVIDGIVSGLFKLDGQMVAKLKSGRGGWHNNLYNLGLLYLRHLPAA